jgi:hypothetical protein
MEALPYPYAASRCSALNQVLAPSTRTAYPPGGRRRQLDDVGELADARDEQYVRELFEGTGIAIEFERKVSDIHHHSVADAVDCYATKFGPVVKARALLDADSRWTELRDDMIKLFQRHNTSGGTRVVLPAQYLVVLGRKAP